MPDLNLKASSAAHAFNNGEVVEHGGDDNDNGTGGGDVDGFEDVE